MRESLVLCTDAARHRSLDSADDIGEPHCGWIECNAVNCFAAEYQLDSIGETVKELLDGEGVKAELDFVLGQDCGGSGSWMARAGFVVEDRPSAFGQFEKAVDLTGDYDRFWTAR